MIKSTASNFKITIVSPVFNEEEIVFDFYETLKKILKSYKHEIIFVNDGSTDNTLKIIDSLQKEDSEIKIINFPKNQGQQNAIMAGLFKATGDAIIVMDSDLQDHPRHISELLEMWGRGYEVVFARRLKREDSNFKKITAFLYYRLLYVLTGGKICPDCGDFYLLDKKTVRSLIKIDQKPIFLRGLLAMSDFKKSEILICRGKRIKGKTGYPLYKMIKLAINGVIFSIKWSFNSNKRYESKK